MAGAKETPRQKLINLMYLVLLAMLALQVSAAIIQKFEFLNDSLELTIEEADKRNQQTLVRMKASVEQNKSAPEDLALYKTAEDIRKRTKDILDRINTIKKKLIVATGGYDESGKLKGLKEEEPVAAMMLGRGDSKNGKAYELQKELNGYIRELNQIMSKAKIKKNFSALALDGKEDPLFKSDPEQNIKDFARLNFESTPLVAALAVLSEKENKILSIESEILEIYAAKLGQFIIPVDRVHPVIMSPSNTVVAGTEFSADMFMAAYSSNFQPNMTFNNTKIDVNQSGVGKIKFKAQGGNYDPETGLLKRNWKGSITYPKPGGGDSTYIVSHDYFVAKPNIEFKSAAVKELYFKSENKMTITVPALGANSNLSYKAKNAKIIATGKRNEVRIVPNSNRTVEIEVYKDNVLLGNEKFVSKKAPRPVLTPVSNNRPIDPVRGITTGQITRIKVNIEPNAEFKKLNPRDNHYKISKSEVILVRNGRSALRGSLKDLNNIKREARSGDRIVIEVKEISRKNFEGEIEKTILSGEIYNIAITGA